MRRKPLKILLDKVGHHFVANKVGVDVSLVYRWQYQEDKKSGGRRPNVKNAVAIARLAETVDVKSLTIEYLAGL